MSRELDLEFLNSPIPKDIKKLLVPVLRKYWKYWPTRNQAIKNSRVARGNYQCAMCKVSTFKRTELHVDHIDPVQTLYNKLETWYDMIMFISRLFVSEDKLQVLCAPCHTVKTSLETKMRKHYRNEKKSLDKNEDK